MQPLKHIGVAPGQLGGRQPSAAAASAIFSPCSSVPVKNRTSKPSSRLNRAIASVAMYSYTCPSAAQHWDT
ncbi:hypothetical protein I553_4233 [Mycobacterium xenopi 4042]|uniref:Uncharacterized protein n=1 Tax=Mycobacterium xenopi 4042 TaxID=1299334 RepID=X8AG30_MYCXE|nr:hypothetical protein I553_4233 [Mycobacterium xenopi 4042]